MIKIKALELDNFSSFSLNKQLIIEDDLDSQLLLESSKIIEFFETFYYNPSFNNQNREFQEETIETFLALTPYYEELPLIKEWQKTTSLNLINLDLIINTYSEKLLTKFSVESDTDELQFLFPLYDLKFNPFVNKVGFDLAVFSGGLSTAYANFTTNSWSSSTSEALEVKEIPIDAYVTEDGDVQQLLASLTELGLKHGAVFNNTVSGILPVQAIAEVGNLPALKFLRTNQALTNVGATTTQGDVAMRSDDARSSFDVDGTGVTVGILSDSYDNLGGARNDILSGDLPGRNNPLGNNIPVNVLQDIPTNDPFFPGNDEGRAIAQLVHDVAPGAALAFHSASLGQANFANGIIELAAAGSDIIVDDVIYFAEPMFQDGIIAQAVDQVVADGAAYFSSAGNNSRNSYESEFNNSGVLEPFFGGRFHDFDPGAGIDIFQSFTIPEGSTLILSFQWDSPFFSVSGGTGSPNDLDVFLFDDQNNVVAAGVTNNVGADAVELLGFINDGSSGSDQFNLAISQFAGAEAGLMKYVRFGSSDVVVNEYDTQSSTTYGHSNAQMAESVGAAFYQNTPEFGVEPALLQPFSSVGGTPILFDTSGDRLTTPEIREKTNIVAPDGGNTTFFPPSPLNPRDREEDGFPNFFGTSAAAPHAAAVAALMLEANPGTTPEEIYQALESTALDMDDPFTPGFDVGFDNATGYGLIQADRAIEALLDNNPTPPPQPQPVLEPNDTLDRAIATNLTPNNSTKQAIFNGRIGDNPNLFVFQDVDLFEFQLTTGERVTLDIDTGIRSGLNSVLRLFDRNGNELAVSNNDPAPDESLSPDSYISFTANQTSSYYVGVSGFDNLNYDPSLEGSGEGGTQGDYTLIITVIPDDLSNGGFETGNFDNWETLGDVAIQAADFGINPTQGDKQAFLTNSSDAATDSDLEVFAGLQPGELDTLNNGFTVEGSAIKRTINVSAGDILSFDWNFITNENTPDSLFNDFAFVSITPGTALEIADTRSNFIDSDTRFREETGYLGFSYTFESSGTFTLAVGVVDVVDNQIDSGLLVDNFSIDSV